MASASASNLITLLFSAFLAVFLHELAHIAVARANGLQVKRIGLNWKGAHIVRQRGGRQQEISTALAGPLANLLLVSTHNLLPLPGSDGRRVLQAVRLGGAA